MLFEFPPFLPQSATDPYAFKRTNLVLEAAVKVLSGDQLAVIRKVQGWLAHYGRSHLSTFLPVIHKIDKGEIKTMADLAMAEVVPRWLREEDKELRATRTRPSRTWQAPGYPMARTDNRPHAA